MKLLTSLPLALLSGHALAACGTGFPRGPTHGLRSDECTLGPRKLFTCGNSGTSVQQIGRQIRLQAGNVDTTVLVSCDNVAAYYYHCTAGDSETFAKPGCAGTVTSVGVITKT
ncbi:hypothetical protein E4U34_001711 [Claviceps purpurea]|nr:hypothetical protein E4U38_002620 [Claviceps purpurea]KAG6138997.1 hypothetical protein E4U12_007747 [Claviceps purpurea]KAG6154660.1 hypothetical protein E4U37_001869 [Claviceps purpurea]KAG6181032.1 hypothetical protein E4U27_002520 [Claviceps purpurea]KAG6215102.1 hypothetical protein E4U26_000138 [Claviceps purpurea]